MGNKLIHDAGRHPGQWMLPSLMHSFVGQSSIRELCPPALVLERERTEGRKREKFYIYLDVTHTYIRTYRQTDIHTYHTIPYHTIPYNTLQYRTIPYNTIQYHTIPYNTIQYHRIPYNTIQYHTIPYIPYIPCHAMPCHTIHEQDTLSVSYTYLQTCFPYVLTLPYIILHLPVENAGLFIYHLDHVLLILFPRSLRLRCRKRSFQSPRRRRRATTALRQSSSVEISTA